MRKTSFEMESKMIVCLLLYYVLDLFIIVLCFGLVSCWIMGMFCVDITDLLLKHVSW